MTSPDTPARPRRTRVHHLQEMKARGERWPMLTAYDVNTARIFDEAGVPVLLVGDSAGNTVLGYDTTVPVTTEELPWCAGPRTPSWSPTCRSGATRSRSSRPSRPPSSS